MSETTETERAILDLIKPFFWPLLAGIGIGSGGFMAGQNQTGADVAQMARDIAVQRVEIDELKRQTKARAALTACGARHLQRINDKLGLTPPCELDEMANIGL
jgi:hypothetical protein